MQHNQYPMEHYAFEVKAPADRYDTKMYKRLQVAERDIKEIHFNPHPERLRLANLDALEGFKSEILHTANYDEDCDSGTTYGHIKHEDTEWFEGRTQNTITGLLHGWKHIWWN